MAEYIEKKWAIENVIHAKENHMDEVEALERTIAADVAPVVHGRWVLEREPDGKPYCFHCSACDGDFHNIGITVAYDYCPNCGARMDGGGNDS